MLVSLEIPSKDHAYPWFLEWMAQNSAEATAPAASSSLGLFQRLGKLKGLRSHELAVETSYKKHDNGSSEALFSLVPGPGTHWFRYRGAWMQVRPLRPRAQACSGPASARPCAQSPPADLSLRPHLHPSLRSSATGRRSRWTCTRARPGRR